MPPKQRISIGVRAQVWNYWCGPEAGLGSCFVCAASVDKMHFEVGHVVAEARGGTLELANLRVVCARCNKWQGERDMLDYRREMLAVGDRMDVEVVPAALGAPAAPAPAPPPNMGWAALTCDALRAACRARHLPTGGNKAALIARLGAAPNFCAKPGYHTI